jgi:hypothetical protein
LMIHLMHLLLPLPISMILWIGLGKNCLNCLRKV